MKKERKSKEKGKIKTKTLNKNYKPKSKSKLQQQPMKQLPSPYLIANDGEAFKLTLHNNYTLKNDHALFQNMKNLFKLYTEKEKRRNRQLFQLSQFSYFPHFQFDLSGEKPEENKCSICQFQFESFDIQTMEKQLLSQQDTDIIILKCTHLLHFSCFQMLVGEKDWFKCPVCSTIYGKMIGDQPPGNMSVFTDDYTHCDGFPECGTIIIDYSMHSGKRGTINFPGTHRTAYLPNNEAGQQVLELLREAFDRKLIFTVGRSVTTGRDNQIVWNGIHHKTSLSGGSSHFGYPDPTYFERVKLQLAAKGIH